VDEAFYLGAALRHDLTDLVDVQLAGQHHALEAELLELAHPEGVVDGHLGRGVQRDPREVFAGEAGDRHVLQDHAVDPHRLQRRQGVDQLREFRFLDERVQGDVQLFAVAVGIGCHPLHLGGGEVFCLGARREIAEAGVDCIGPLFHGGEK
jgi:hypothetical protein